MVATTQVKKYPSQTPPATKGMNIKVSMWLMLALFVLTRIYIWIDRPQQFTEIIYSYMPYAHLWADGLVPYLQQWYEYPPLTIPLFYLPHLIDMATLPFWWHIHYLTAYRLILLGFDGLILGLILKSMRHFRVNLKQMWITVIFYCAATAKAHTFIYDSMDYVFAAFWCLSVTMPYLWKTFGGTVMEWIGYFGAVGLKLINAPIGLAQLILERKQLRKSLLALMLAGMVTWMVPLGYFRSSLQVMLVYHSKRGLQVESVPAQIAATINRFTQTEAYKEVYKNYDITGPVSGEVKKVYDVLFPVALLVYVAWSSLIAWKAEEQDKAKVRIGMSLGYVYCFMLFAKVLSTPFLLWQIPLLCVYPFVDTKKQLRMLIPALIMIAVSMTLIPNLPVGRFSLHIFIGWIRSGLIAYLFWQSIQLLRVTSKKNRL